MPADRPQPDRREGGAPADPPSPLRARKRDTAGLAAGSGISGLLAYVVFAVSTRALGADAAAPVSVLWTYWGFAGAAFTFPLQHWIARTVTAHGDGAVRQALPLVSGVIVVSSVVVGGLCWLGRSPLFHVDGLAWPALAAGLTLGSGLIGVVRGRLNASRRFVSIGLSLIAENGLRCVAVGALFLAGVTNPVAYGLGLVAGHLVSIWWLPSVRFGRSATSLAQHAPLTFLSGAGLAQLLGQIVLTGSPVVLALAGGSPSHVTALFTTLALFRAPYILALGLVSQLTSMITAMVVAGEAAALRRLRAAVLLVTAVAIVGAAVVGEWLGPPILRLIFGTSVRFDATHCAIGAVACTLAVANLVVMIGVLAHDRPTTVAVGWVGAVAVGAVVFAALSGIAPEDQIVWCFLASEAAALVILTVLEARHARAAT